MDRRRKAFDGHLRRGALKSPPTRRRRAGERRIRRGRELVRRRPGDQRPADSRTTTTVTVTATARF